MADEHLQPDWPAVIVALAALASSFHGIPALNTVAFTFWVFVRVAAGLFYPAVFLEAGGFNQTSLIVPLIQLIMFGMGASLSAGGLSARPENARGCWSGYLPS